MSFFRMNIVMAALAAIVMVGCNANDPVDPGTAPDAPSGTMVQSVSASSVRVKWTGPAITTDVTGYDVVATEVTAGTPEVMKVTVSGAASTVGDVGGLTEGKTYRFTVFSLNGTTRSSTSSVAVEWAPARRGTGSYRLYSSANATQGSGLGIFLPAGPNTLLTAAGGQWDIAFDDGVAGSPRIGSPGVSSYVNANAEFKSHIDQVAKVVFLSTKQYPGISTLDDMFDTDALAIPATSGEGLISINSIGGTANLGFVIGSANADGTINFAKILLKRGANGQFVQGTGAMSYVDVEVSYQKFADVPYALRQRVSGTTVSRNARTIESAK